MSEKVKERDARQMIYIGRLRFLLVSYNTCIIRKTNNKLKQARCHGFFHLTFARVRIYESEMRVARTTTRNYLFCLSEHRPPLKSSAPMRMDDVRLPVPACPNRCLRIVVPGAVLSSPMLFPGIYPIGVKSFPSMRARLRC